MRLGDINGTLPVNLPGDRERDRLILSIAGRRLSRRQHDVQLIPGMCVDTFPLRRLQDKLLHEYTVILENHRIQSVDVDTPLSVLANRTVAY